MRNSGRRCPSGVAASGSVRHIVHTAAVVFHPGGTGSGENGDTLRATARTDSANSREPTYESPFERKRMVCAISGPMNGRQEGRSPVGTPAGRHPCPVLPFDPVRGVPEAGMRIPIHTIDSAIKTDGRSNVLIAPVPPADPGTKVPRSRVLRNCSKEALKNSNNRATGKKVVFREVDLPRDGIDFRYWDFRPEIVRISCRTPEACPR